MNPRNPFAVLGALILFLLIGCILDSRQAGRGSEVENELGAYGILVDKGGKPVEGAKVKARPAAVGVGKYSAAIRAQADSDSVETDADGRYSFPALAEGEYDLFGNKGSELVVLIPDVEVRDTGRGVDVGVDTLRAPGAIRGRVLADGEGKPAVLAYVPGTSFLAATDDSGRFELARVPQGVYRVSYSAAGFLVSTDSGVIVEAGKTTSLPDKRLESDPALPPPAPKAIASAYDTLTERAELSWSPVFVSDLAGYVVYVDKPGFPGSVPLPIGITRDPHYVDSISDGPDSGQGAVRIYRIKAIDKEENVSTVFSPPLAMTISSRSFVTTAMVINTEGTVDGKAGTGDTVRIRAKFGNPTRAIESIEWKVGGAERPLRRIAVHALSGEDTLVFVADSAGTYSIAIKAVDAGGKEWSASAQVEVSDDPPLARAGRDTMVSIGDRVALRGSSSKRFGPIMRREWIVDGAPPVGVGADSGLLITAGSAPRDSVPCIFRAWDDHGRMAADTLYLDIVLDPPAVDAGPDTTVSPGDTVRLKGTATDRFGRIAGTAWDIGGNGFKDSRDGTASIVVPARFEGTLRCIFRAVDDDGNVAEDTLRLAVSFFRPMAYAGKDTVVSINDRIELKGSGQAPHGRITAWEWDIGASGNFKSGNPDTSFFAPNLPDSGLECILRVTDDDGVQDSDTVIVQVRRDAPMVTAGKGSAVSIGDPLRLRATAKQDFGSIVKWEWRCGTEPLFTVADSILIKAAPSVPRERYACVARATDDDGNIGEDTTVFQVVADAPLAKASAPTLSAESGQRVRVSGKGSSDGFGAIMRYLWLMPGAAKDTVGVSMDTVVSMPFSPKDTLIAVVLRVTDDDGLSDDDTLRFAVRKAPPLAWTKVSDSIGVGWHFPKAALVFQGGIWLLCQSGVDGEANQFSLWASRDGSAWDRKGLLPVEYDSQSDETDLWALGNRLFLYHNGALWFSDDGAAWSLALASVPFKSRYGMHFVERTGTVYCFGGGSGNGVPYAEVWSSTDGIAWTPLTLRLGGESDNSPMPYVSGGRLWAVTVDDATGTFKTWVSDDGIDWSFVREGTELRYDESNMFRLGESLYSMPNTWYNEWVWITPNGADWQIVGAKPPEVKGQGVSVAFDGKIWLFDWIVPGPSGAGVTTRLHRTE